MKENNLNENPIINSSLEHNNNNILEEELIIFFLQNENSDIYYDTDMDKFLHNEKETKINKSNVSSISELDLIIDKNLSFRKLNSIKSIINIKDKENRNSNKKNSVKNVKKLRVREELNIKQRINKEEKEKIKNINKSNNYSEEDKLMNLKKIISQSFSKNKESKLKSLNINTPNEIKQNQLIFKLINKNLRFKSPFLQKKVNEKNEYKCESINLNSFMKISNGNSEFPYFIEKKFVNDLNIQRNINLKFNLNKNVNASNVIYRNELNPIKTFNLGMKKKPKLTKFTFDF